MIDSYSGLRSTGVLLDSQRRRNPTACSMAGRCRGVGFGGVPVHRQSSSADSGLLDEHRRPVSSDTQQHLAGLGQVGNQRGLRFAANRHRRVARCSQGRQAEAAYGAAC